MGLPTRRRTGPARTQPDPRPAILPQLRTDMVRIDASRRRPNQSEIERPFAGTHPSLGTTVELLGFLGGLQLPPGLAYESHGQM